MKKTFTLLFLIVSIHFLIFAQFCNSYAQDDDKTLLSKLKINGYVDFYYSWDTDKNKILRQFPAFNPYRDQFKLNIAQVSFSENLEFVRGKVTIQYGDIPKILYPADEQYIQEANVGISPVKNLWIDIGYFLTHIGYESFPMNSFFSSYSMGSYVQPLYQSGVKVGYDFSDKLWGCVHILNGYNVLTDNNKNKSFGFEITYKPTSLLTFDYNSIVGNEMPNEVSAKTRFFNDLITYYSPSDKLDLILGLDFATQEKSKLSDQGASATMYSASLSARYKICTKYYISLRGEYFSDEDGFLSGLFINDEGSLSGLKSWGITGAFEYRPIENCYFRIESRFLSADSKLKIFYNNTNTRTEININTGIQF